MGIATIEDIASEFLRIIEEGWDPEIEDFLRHVPEDLREQARKRILEVTGRARTPEPEPEPAKPEPVAQVEIVVKPEPAPAGPQRLTREEAKQMFLEMERRRAKKSGG